MTLFEPDDGVKDLNFSLKNKGKCKISTLKPFFFLEY